MMTVAAEAGSFGSGSIQNTAVPAVLGMGFSAVVMGVYRRGSVAFG